MLSFFLSFAIYYLATVGIYALLTTFLPFKYSSAIMDWSTEFPKVLGLIITAIAIVVAIIEHTL